MTSQKVTSVSEYAKSRGVSRQYILKLISKGRSLDGVIEYFKAGATYVLVLN